MMSHLPTLCKLGPLTLDIDPTLIRHVAELGALPHLETPSVPDLRVEVVDDLPDIAATHHVGKQALSFSRTALSVRSQSVVQYSVTNLFGDQPTHLSLVLKLDRGRPRPRQFLLRAAAQAPHQGIFLPTEIPSYSLLWYVTAVSLLKQRCAFVHAAALECNGRATILAGSGGCGKTSTLLLALAGSTGKYLAEDFAVVDQNGDSHYVPKTVTLYHSDLERGGMEGLRQYHKRYKAMSLLTGRRNPKLKVTPEALVGSDRLGTRSPIGQACFLNRTTVGSLSLSPLSLDEFCSRAMLASMRELKSLVEILYMITANAPPAYPYPSVDQMERRMLDVYHSAFKSVSPQMLSIPHAEHPRRVTEYLFAQGVLSK